MKEDNIYNEKELSTEQEFKKEYMESYRMMFFDPSTGKVKEIPSWPEFPNDSFEKQSRAVEYDLNNESFFE